MNSLGVCLQSVAEVKDKWRGMVISAKKEHTKYAASQRETGGGKKSASPLSATKKIIDLFGEDPSFSGIAGSVESGKQPQFLFKGPTVYVAGQTVKYCYL